MWLKLSRNYRFQFIDLPVANYRLHDYNSLKTSSYQLKVDMLKVLLREREYSYSHGYGKKWEYAYYSRLINIAYKYKPRIFLDYFIIMELKCMFRISSSVISKSFNLFFLRFKLICLFALFFTTLTKSFNFI